MRIEVHLDLTDEAVSVLKKSYKELESTDMPRLRIAATEVMDAVKAAILEKESKA